MKKNKEFLILETTNINQPKKGNTASLRNKKNTTNESKDKE